MMEGLGLVVTVLLAVVSKVQASSQFDRQHQEESFVEYVNLLGGSLSKYDTSSGSTLPLLTRPWGAAAWAPM